MSTGSQRNRSALEWVVDQYKEKKPSDPTIAEKFNTCRSAYGRQVRGLQGEGDRLVEAGDDGECGGPGQRAGMEVVWGMEGARR